MRLWHQDLIETLPRAQLLGQHRECCALRGRGWGRPHATVNYVFRYSPYLLYRYHQLVMTEMQRRGYRVSSEWLIPTYRGQYCAPYDQLTEVAIQTPIYPEHDVIYYEDCIENLKQKQRRK